MQDVSGLLDRLLGFLELGKACVTAETLIQIKDLLRRYPHIADVAIASVASISLQAGGIHAQAYTNLDKTLLVVTVCGVAVINGCACSVGRM